MNTYSGIMTEFRISQFLKQIRKYEWVGYALMPLLLLIKICYNTLCVTTATLLEDNVFSFKSNFNVCLKAECIFILALITKALSFLLFKKVSTLVDLSYVPFSVLSLLNPNQLPKWSLYGLQTLNVWEVLFCIFGVMLFSFAYKTSKKKAFLLFAVPYIAGLFLIIFVATFISLQFSN